ncbi:acyl carrier protein [Saccharopolyspora erythraea NRRL 2338]|uniref:Acyl carrier protein n=2 Tax=Saccharopolyspora erythraea TaxID=1836 RepID=ACP_SACEN|nr:acyl carrier protein [Saccharopolyspora erythraea]P11830.2 RecName: Full=Acyl carrier protein; Short=ACP [Saccharopolyspora erythraea NRRL 2338]AAA26476.1 acyl carrier protein [Saccharopolyspora erythraea]AAQ94255.1 acyl carrier protien [Saccharopolyspora erythraea]PFG97101.1 acyl carrier protein [Saccharopolyspora erythraea NRRL 2338]QRK87310.1 acyl carrier protein [Saccharopolyspora erythraea]CAM03401.1 acyl carrier protein [Saccharopolyspora erythraea NRRL 2338]
MDRKEIFERIEQVLAEQLGIPAEQITEEADLREDLGMDSLDLVELVSALEDEVGMRVEQSQLEGIETVGHVMELTLDLVARLATASAADKPEAAS